MKKIKVILILVPFLAFGQTPKQKEILKLADELFDLNINVAANLSSNDIQPSSNKMNGGTKSDKNALQKCIKEYEKDTLNPVFLNNLALCYFNRGDYDLSNKYYLKAYKNLDIIHFDKDSSQYYSFRGSLKANLGDSTAISDFEKAISINPKDSLSTVFYPLMLCSTGKFKKATAYSEKLFKTDINESIPYLFLTMSSLSEGISKLEGFKNKDSKEISHRKIIDYKLLDDYSKKYKTNQIIQNCRLISELLGYFYKIAAVNISKDSKHLKMDFTAKELKGIRKIIKELNNFKKKKKMNMYSCNKNLGIAYFLLQDWDKSIAHYDKAISIFPKDKSNSNFSIDECYDTKMMIYYRQNDFVNLEKVIVEKMATKENKSDELSLLAHIYYKQKNIEKAEEYCNKTLEVNENNFDALLLLSYLKFSKGLFSIAEYHGQAASKVVNNESNYYSVMMLFTIYQTYNNAYDQAKPNLEQVRKITNGDCDLCDKLMKFIE